MKKFEKVLFFYSIVAVTGLFLLNAAFAPSLQGILSAALLFPLFAYFWLKFTSPDKVDTDKWSIRLLIVLAVLGALVFFVLYQSKLTKGEKDDQAGQIGSLREEILGLKDEVELKDGLISELESKLEESDTIEETPKPTNILGETFSDLLVEKKVKGQIELKEGYTKANVYKEPTFSSLIIGQISAGSTFDLLETKDPWFQIKYGGDEGWVEKTQVTITADEE